MTSSLGDPEAEHVTQGKRAGAGKSPVSAGPRKGPGDPKAPDGPVRKGADRSHQIRSLHVPGRGGRPAPWPARGYCEGVPGAAGQAGREKGSKRSDGGDPPATKSERGVCVIHLFSKVVIVIYQNLMFL